MKNIIYILFFFPLTVLGCNICKKYEINSECSFSIFDVYNRCIIYLNKNNNDVKTCLYNYGYNLYNINSTLLNFNKNCYNK
jgi:hypothetical protein